MMYIIPAKCSYPMSKFSYNGSKRYAEYEVVSVNGILLQKSVFCDLGEKAKCMVKVQIEMKSKATSLQLNTPTSTYVQL